MRSTKLYTKRGSTKLYTTREVDLDVERRVIKFLEKKGTIVTKKDQLNSIIDNLSTNPKGVDWSAYPFRVFTYFKLIFNENKPDQLSFYQRKPPRITKENQNQNWYLYKFKIPVLHTIKGRFYLLCECSV